GDSAWASSAAWRGFASWSTFGRRSLIPGCCTGFTRSASGGSLAVRRLDGVRAVRLEPDSFDSRNLGQEIEDRSRLARLPQESRRFGSDARPGPEGGSPADPGPR